MCNVEHTEPFLVFFVMRFKKGVAHTHTAKGGREDNIRYMTEKEIKKFGKFIEFMGGKVNE